MSETIAGITIPETALVRDATDFVRQAADGTLFHHSRRVFLWGALKAAARGLEVDLELAYVGALFHNLGLTASHATVDRRFELDGAEAARTFLREHGRPREPGPRCVARHRPTQRAEVVAAQPRPDFKNRILHAFHQGMVDRPDTTFGTMDDDVLAHFDPAFVRRDFVEIIRSSAWPE
ncbi:HD domain-containing protein [Nocardia sp. ET3-3]|uniref:HD domain-containing protein n=1 Tax=Nocardia terrae TaxID=2675851 RepID=A0A7K1V2R1_9NOCA|nr:HD domain-containing protein [Nocardia terrae]MVU80895.1 HD domain-containing protein [Nocardia terrae]